MSGRVTGHSFLFDLFFKRCILQPKTKKNNYIHGKRIERFHVGSQNLYFIKLENFLTGFEVNAPVSCNKSLKSLTFVGFFVFYPLHYEKKSVMLFIILYITLYLKKDE